MQSNALLCFLRIEKFEIDMFLYLGSKPDTQITNFTKVRKQTYIIGCSRCIHVVIRYSLRTPISTKQTQLCTQSNLKIVRQQRTTSDYYTSRR